MKFNTDDYKVWDDENQTVHIEGSLRLGSSKEYAFITNLLHDVLKESDNKKIDIDLSQLIFLNSSGINILSKFAIYVRKQGAITFSVKGSKSIPWQGKSLPNLKKLYPALELEFT
ncbi:MAG: hypothetical protein HON94_11610 [Methylococcales bacterium]|jgi:hypothetical protein|nr:hypothetical protein [Methylococcales bacterium]MBT7408317.1 hypothetical protein [Methylococcales bacterium]